MTTMWPNHALERTAAPLVRSTVAGVRERVVRFTFTVGGDGSAFVIRRYSAVIEHVPACLLEKIIEPEQADDRLRPPPSSDRLAVRKINRRI